MAESYGDPAAEHSRVRSTAGLLDLTCCGAICVSGKESIQFLNGLVTNDVKLLEKGKGLRAAFLTGHGKVRALCRVLGLGDEFLILNDPQTHEKVFKYIFPFSYAGDFKVRDTTDQFRVLSVQGPRAAQVMREICFEPVPKLDEHHWIATLVAGHQVKIVRSNHTGEMGFDILVPTAGLRDVWEFTLMKGEFHSIGPVGFGALEVLRIEAGIPAYGVDADESNMMLELGLADAVSFTKGCYTGQEAVAMATYRGHISKKLSGLVFSERIVPSPGSDVYKDDKQIGHVTSSVLSPTLGKAIALAYIKYGFFDPGIDVEVQGAPSVASGHLGHQPPTARSREASLGARVSALPFYTPSSESPLDVGPPTVEVTPKA
jgi:folate-binding protein YgfZ